MSDEPEQPDYDSPPKPLDYRTPPKYRPPVPPTPPDRRPERWSFEPGGPGLGTEAVVGFIVYAAAFGLVFLIADHGGPTAYWIIFLVVVLMLVATVYMDQRWRWRGFGIGVLLGLLVSCLIGGGYVFTTCSQILK